MSRTHKQEMRKRNACQIKVSGKDYGVWPSIIPYSRSYGSSPWLSKLMKSKYWKHCTWEGKQIHPKIVYQIVSVMWAVVWERVIKGKVVSLNYLGEVNQIHRKYKGQIRPLLVWYKKPHPHIKLRMSQHYYKILNS